MKLFALSAASLLWLRAAPVAAQGTFKIQGGWLF